MHIYSDLLYFMFSADPLQHGILHCRNACSNATFYIARCTDIISEYFAEEYFSLMDVVLSLYRQYFDWLCQSGKKQHAHLHKMANTKTGCS